MMGGDSNPFGTDPEGDAPAEPPSFSPSTLDELPAVHGSSGSVGEDVPIGSAAGGISSFQDLDISSGAATSSQSAGRFAGDGSSGSAAPPPGAGASPDLAVSVAHPMKVGEGMNAYFTYEVATRTSLPQYAYGQFSVTRRFRDFDWVHASLVQKFPGAIVPPLPEKHSAQVSTLKMTGVAQSAAWLEERRAALQRFLHRLVAHPALHTAPDLQAFLEKPEDALEAWKEQSKPPKAPLYSSLATDVKAGLLSSYSRSVSLFGGDSASAAFTPVQDVPCQQMGNYATALQTQVTAVHKHSKSYIERHKNLGTALTGFGLALTQLSDCEAAINDSLSRGISHMGLCVARLSATYAEQAEREAAAFEEPIKDYSRVLGAVKAAIGAREAALRANNSASAALATKRERLDKLRGAGGKEDKVAALAREVTEAEEAVNLTKAEYEAIVARVDAEMARFQREKL